MYLLIRCERIKKPSITATRSSEQRRLFLEFIYNEVTALINYPAPNMFNSSQAEQQTIRIV